MLKRYYFFTAAIFIILIPAILFLSCDIKNPVEGVHVIFNAAPVTTSVSIDFIDAKTGSQIGFNRSKNIQLNIKGRDMGSVVDLTNDPQTSFSSTVGVVQFAIKEGVIPTADNPIEILLIANSPGYQTTSTPITIAGIGDHSFSITMVDQANPPRGVTINTGTAGRSDNSGRVTTPINLKAEDPSSRGSAEITVPVNTVVRDATGQPLSGTLRTAVAYYNNQDEESMRAFPGGFLVQTEDRGRGYFVTAGFASFEITDANGKKARNFDTPIEIKMYVPANTMNPETNSIIKNGDIVPVWSYNEDSGEWKFETNGTAEGPDANGNFMVKYSVSHLSWWNLDWKSGDYCATGTTISINGAFNYLKLKAKRKDNGQYFWYSGYVNKNNPSVTIYNAPRNLPVTVEAYSGCYYNELVGSVDISDLCGSSATLDVNVEIPTPVSVKVRAYCEKPNPDDIKYVQPNIGIWYKDDCGWKYAGMMSNGEITINLVLGQSYTFGVYYQGKWYENESPVIDKENYEFDYKIEDDEICKSL